MLHKIYAYLYNNVLLTYIYYTCKYYLVPVECYRDDLTNTVIRVGIFMLYFYVSSSLTFEQFSTYFFIRITFLQK